MRCCFDHIAVSEPVRQSKTTSNAGVQKRILCNFLVMIMVFLGLLPGCRTSSSLKPEYLSLQLGANPTTLDPALIVDVSGATIAAKLFNGLVRYDRDLNLQPDLAERWSVSNDGTTYTFVLRQGVLFTNGRELTAADVKYSFERVLAPATRSPRTWVLNRIRGASAYCAGTSREVSGIDVRDRYAVAITLEEPFGPFLSLLSLTTAYIVPREAVEAWGPDFSFHVVGTGPYRLQEWQHGSRLLLAANAQYFQGPPRLQGIIYRIIPEELTTMVEFETGNLDIIRIPGASYQRYRDHPHWTDRMIQQNGLNTYYLGFNCQKPPLNDARVRQAICFAVDREKIRATVFESRGIAAAGPIPPLLRKTLPPLVDQYPYDPAKARSLLAAAGYPDGFPLRITIAFLPETLAVVEVIQHYLQAVGIRCQILQLEWSSFKETVARGETDVFWLSWWADYPDIENFLYPLFHSSNYGAGGNRTFYSNARVDDLIEQAQQTPDEHLRLAAYAEAERLIIADAPMVFFWHTTDYFLCHARVRGFIPHPLAIGEKGLEVTVHR